MKYLLELSTKRNIILDQADYDKFVTVSSTGNFVKLKQGIVNPSFVVDIVPVDEEPKRKINGYIDEKTGKFVVTEDEEYFEPVENKMDSVVQLASKMKI